MAKRGTKRVLEYARLAMGFANVRAGTLESTNAGAGAGLHRTFAPPACPTATGGVGEAVAGPEAEPECEEPHATKRLSGTPLRLYRL